MSALATREDERERELRNELVDAERDEAAAESEWRELLSTEQTLRGNGVRRVQGRRLIRLDGSERDEGYRNVRSTVMVDGRERFVDELDGAERAALLAGIDGRRGEVATRYTSARRRAESARQEVANF